MERRARSDSMAVAGTSCGKKFKSTGKASPGEDSAGDTPEDTVLGFGLDDLLEEYQCAMESMVRDEAAGRDGPVEVEMEEGEPITNKSSRKEAVKVLPKAVLEQKLNHRRLEKKLTILTGKVHINTQFLKQLIRNEANTRRWVVFKSRNVTWPKWERILNEVEQWLRRGQPSTQIKYDGGLAVYTAPNNVEHLAVKENLDWFFSAGGGAGNFAPGSDCRIKNQKSMKELATLATINGAIAVLTNKSSNHGKAMDFKELKISWPTKGKLQLSILRKSDDEVYVTSAVAKEIEHVYLNHQLLTTEQMKDVEDGMRSAELAPYTMKAYQTGRPQLLGRLRVRRTCTSR